MKIFFNEQSFFPDIILSTYAIRRWLKDIYPAVKNYGISHCWMQSSDLYKIRQLTLNPHDKTLSDFMYGFFSEPFEGKDQSLTEVFVQHEWKNKGIDCQGLAFASIANTLALSFFSDRWNDMFVTIQKDGRDITVRHFASAAHLYNHAEWIVSLRKPILTISNLLPKDKMCHLRDDHGKDILVSFSHKLLKSPYVVSVVNSLPFSSHAIHFIDSCTANGLVNIVLPWTDEGLGLVVQTTGKNKRETEAIAKLLENEFG